MKFDPQKNHRRSIRLPGHDYSQPGAYFVTLNTYQREGLFGEIRDGKMLLSVIGQIVDEYWRSIPDHFPNVRLDAYVVMPDHLHGIIVLGKGAVPAPDLSNLPAPDMGEITSPIQALSPIKKPTLGQVIAYFKYQSTKEMNVLDNTGTITKFWQRNYYEHMIRDDGDYHRVEQYIQANVRNWSNDEENPVNPR